MQAQFPYPLHVDAAALAVLLANARHPTLGLKHTLNRNGLGIRLPQLVHALHFIGNGLLARHGDAHVILVEARTTPRPLVARVAHPLGVTIGLSFSGTTHNFITIMARIGNPIKIVCGNYAGHACLHCVHAPTVAPAGKMSRGNNLSWQILPSLRTAWWDYD